MEERVKELVKRIQLTVHRKMNTVFVGEYHSAFKGSGLSFERVREYQAGDEVKLIDWNVSARMNHLYVKEFSEERELSIVFLVDVSASLDFGTSRIKRDVLHEMVTLLTYMAQSNNDRVMMVLFTDRVEHVIMPRKGRKYLLHVLRELVGFEPKGSKTDIDGAIEYTRRILKKRSVVFCISDFIGNYSDTALRRMAAKHDLIPVVISDPAEITMKNFGLVEYIDLETGETILSDTVPSKRKLPAFNGIDAMYLSTDTPVEVPVLRFFSRRNRSRLKITG